jgi:hypothetical protein
MKVLFKPKIDYTPNLGIIVPAYYPYNLISYFSWFSFAKNLPNIKPVFFVYGYPNFDVIPWARRLKFKIIHLETNFDVDHIQNMIKWQESYIIAFSNVFCLRRFNIDQEIFSKYLVINGKNKPKINICNKFFEKSGELFYISDVDARDIAYRAINSKDAFDILDNCNKIRLSNIVKESLIFRPLIEKELCHETIQF